MQLIAAGAVLTVVGAAMVWASRVQARRRCGPTPAPHTGRPAVMRALTCTSVTAGVITGVQWAALSLTSPTTAPTTAQAAVWLVVLGVPAFLAGATVARLLALVRVLRRRGHPVRTVAGRTRGVRQ